MAESYRRILGIGLDEPVGKYCSVCTPVWYTEKGEYGIGPNPDPKPGEGLWHGRFTRMFLPKGQFETSPNGNLRKIGTTDEQVDKYALNPEDL